MKNKGNKTTTAVASSAIANTNLGANFQQAELTRHIAEAAYYKSEARGFASGHEIDDWLSAEKEILQ